MKGLLKEKTSNRIMSISLLYIDLFCGGGGTTTGIEEAMVDGEKCATVVACINHDRNAILSHSANHPNALHFTEDIRTFNLSPLLAHLTLQKKRYPNAKVVLWASLECTNFSKAKGGKPRDADSRTLAEHLFRYIEEINPDYIQIENVEEFMSWGDIDEKGKPISKNKGRSYIRWLNQVMAYGYSYNYRLLNSADFGAYTSRKRLFIQFAKKGFPIAFPEPTHAKKVDSGGMFGKLQKWKAVRDVLDLSDEGVSIFERKKTLSENTLERIYAGLIKFVAKGDKNFISKQFSGHPESKNMSTQEPVGAITTIDHHALISTTKNMQWLLKYNSINKQTGIHCPPSIDEPCPVVSCQSRLGVVTSSFLTAYYGRGHNHSIEIPAPVLTTKDRLAFVNMQYGKSTAVSINAPAPTVTVTPKHNLVCCKHSYSIINHIEQLPTDSKVMKQIKEFMRLYNIFDIKMRMLHISELKQIMGFPFDYILIGTKTEQKKFIGNAVEVNMSRVLCEAVVKRLKIR